MHKAVNTLDAPKAVGPYSQAIVAEGRRMIFVSGQIPLDAATLKLASNDVVEQTRCVLRHLGAVLHAAGAQMHDVVKTTVYIKNMDDFAQINAEYETFFTTNKPARACVEVARLPKDVLVEIDAIAVI